MPLLFARTIHRRNGREPKGPASLPISSACPGTSPGAGYDRASPATRSSKDRIRRSAEVVRDSRHGGTGGRARSGRHIDGKSLGVPRNAQRRSPSGRTSRVSGTLEGRSRLWLARTWNGARASSILFPSLAEERVSGDPAQGGPNRRETEASPLETAGALSTGVRDQGGSCDLSPARKPPREHSWGLLAHPLIDCCPHRANPGPSYRRARSRTLPRGSARGRGFRAWRDRIDTDHGGTVGHQDLWTRDLLTGRPGPEKVSSDGVLAPHASRTRDRAASETRVDQ